MPDRGRRPSVRDRPLSHTDFVGFIQTTGPIADRLSGPIQSDGVMETVSKAPNTPERPWLRLGLLTAAGVAVYVIGRMTGVIGDVDPESIRTAVEDAGALGVVVFVAAFALGLFFHVPGMVFVVAGVLIWGRALGFPVALLGAVVAVSFTFLIVRRAGGQALTTIDKPFVKKVLGQLDARPIRTVIVLRCLFWLAPAMNYALAMSTVRFKHFVVGSAVGLVVPVALVTFLTEMFL